MLLRTFSVHAKVVARDAKEMLNMQDTRTGFVSCKSILKHQKLIIASRCYTWSLGIKISLNRQGSVNQKENSCKSSA